jgi:signal transduction histidine kinase
VIVDRILERISRWDQRALDWGVAIVLTVVSLAGVVVPSSAGERSIDPLSMGLALLMNLPLAFRRRYPTWVMSIVGFATIAYALTGPFAGFGLGVLVALYSVAVYEEPGVAQRGLIFTLAGIVLSFIGMYINEPGAQLLLWFSQLFATCLAFSVAWMLGNLVRTRSVAIEELRQRAAELEAEREENERLAVEAERARIARELHDAVAHNVSVMVVQAGAARRTLETAEAGHDTSQQTREILAAIESTGRATLTEMRRMVGGLRPAGDADYEPAPSITALDPLFAQVRAAGLAVDLAVEGEPRPLPQGVDLSAYRIVQEALTNTLRHAHATRAHVCLRYTDRSLDLEVTDDGRGAAAALVEPAHRGYGLVGMRERAAMLGGQVIAGPRAGGGFTVRATLPLEAAA